MKLESLHLPTLQAMVTKTQARLDDLMARYDQAKCRHIKRALQIEISRLVHEIKPMRSEIDMRLASGEAPVARVTEHALLRFLDRELLYDLQQLEAMILTDEVKAKIEAGATTIPLPSGNALVVRGKVVVTVKPGRAVHP